MLFHELCDLFGCILVITGTFCETCLGQWFPSTLGVSKFVWFFFYIKIATVQIKVLRCLLDLGKECPTIWQKTGAPKSAAIKKAVPGSIGRGYSYSGSFSSQIAYGQFKWKETAILPEMFKDPEIFRKNRRHWFTYVAATWTNIYHMMAGSMHLMGREQEIIKKIIWSHLLTAPT